MFVFERLPPLRRRSLFTVQAIKKPKKNLRQFGDPELMGPITLRPCFTTGLPFQG